MTIGELIGYIVSVKGREFEGAVYDAWLNEVEGMVQTRVHLVPDDKVKRYDRSADEDGSFDDTVLLVPFPYDKLYAPYIEAKVDFANGEYGRYENSMAMFEKFFTEYAAHYAQTYRPADAKKRAALGISFTP